MDLNAKRELARLATLSLVEKKGYATSNEVAKIAGITHSSASMFLNHDYGKWGLNQVEDESCQATVKRHKYVKDKFSSYPFKCETPYIPDLSKMFSEEKVQESKANLDESFNMAVLKAQMNSGYQKKPKPAQIVDYLQPKETMKQRVRRIADSMKSRGKMEIDLVMLRQNIENEVGKVDIKTMESVVDILKAAKYRWK